MKPEKHICIGCGKDTTAKGEICRDCYSFAVESAVTLDAWSADRRDQYERDIDETYGLDIPLHGPGAEH